MHEQGLMKTLLRQVDQIRCREGGNSVSEIRVSVGPLSGVESLQLAAAFERLSGSPEFDRFEDARFVIEEVPLVAKCGECNRETTITDFDFRCPDCQSNLQVIRGETLELVSVTIETNEPTGRTAT